MTLNYARHAAMPLGAPPANAVVQQSHYGSMSTTLAALGMSVTRISNQGLRVELAGTNYTLTAWNLWLRGRAR
jgi:hypothetical protein